MTDPGFWIGEDVLTGGECDSLIEAFSLCEGHSRAGARHLMRNPAAAAVANDKRLLEIARRWVGSSAVPFRATLFAKSALANWSVVWHQDTALPLESRMDSPEWGPWSTKAGILYAQAPTWALARIVALRLHLDASTRENGPLRVIPGSHSRGVLSDVEVFRLAKAEQPMDCIVSQGGVLAMRPLLVHASSKAHSAVPRRLLHIEYADDLRLDAKLRLAIA